MTATSTLKDLLAQANKATKDPSTYPLALELYEAAVKATDDLGIVNPKYANFLCAYARKYHAEGDIPNTLKFFNQAVARDPNSYMNHVRFGTVLVKQGMIDEAQPILERADKLAGATDITHAMAYGNCLFELKDFDGALKQFTLALNGKNKSGPLVRLADVATSMKNYDVAIGYLRELDDFEGKGPNQNRQRRIHIINLLKKSYSEEDTSRLAVCEHYFKANIPNLDEEQNRILGEIVDKGICISDFDSLFGSQHQDLWDAAEKQVQDFANDPEIKDLEKRIMECDDFNSDPHFSGSFKPSIINYRMLKGEMYATEAAYQLYLNKRILDITNSYNEMLSKIRNVALWMNPPISGKNIGERKGSQMWHRDQEDANILKCFIYYTDVDDGCGPTEYIPYSKIKPLRKYSDVTGYPLSSGYPSKYLIDKHIAPSDIMSAKGKKGSIMFFDTNGYHRGGYVTENRRIITMATFLRPLTPFADTNTKLNVENFDESAYPFETNYGLSL